MLVVAFFSTEQQSLVLYSLVAELSEQHPQSEASTRLTGCTNSMSMADHVIACVTKMRVVLIDFTMALLLGIGVCLNIQSSRYLDDSWSSKTRQDRTQHPS